VSQLLDKEQNLALGSLSSVNSVIPVVMPFMGILDQKSISTRWSRSISRRSTPDMLAKIHSYFG
jgi:hypothetical protein